MYLCTVYSMLVCLSARVQSELSLSPSQDAVVSFCSDAVNQSHTQHPASESNCSRGMVNSSTLRGIVFPVIVLGDLQTGSLKGFPSDRSLSIRFTDYPYPGSASSWHHHRVPLRNSCAGADQWHLHVYRDGVAFIYCLVCTVVLLNIVCHASSPASWDKDVLHEVFFFFLTFSAI